MRLLALDLFLPEIRSDLVHFVVEIDRSRCLTIPAALETRLREFERDGLELPLDRIITHAGIELVGSVVDYWQRGEDSARVKRVWDDLSQWRPRCVPHPTTGQPRLVVTPPANPNERVAGTRRWGVGVGLLVATRLYGIPYRFWHATGFARHDLEAPAAGGGIIKVEVRARVDRNNWREAKDAMFGKLSSPADFATAAGILFAPRTTSRPSSADILIVDPRGDNVDSTDHPMLRALLQHYAPFFEHQAGFPPCARFARCLRELAGADRSAFQDYLARGDNKLRAEQPFRTSFWFGEHHFLGTAYYGSAWPEAMTGVVAEPGRGAFYWALWGEVILALQEGRLQDIADMTIQAGSRRFGDRVFVLVDDGTALAWAPSKESLTPRMFDDSAAAERQVALSLAG